jgi:general secretion pathway protein A
MYRAWFGMSADPFSRDIPPDKLFVSSQFEELATRLDYLIKQKGIGLLTGEAGSGKTTALRSMCHTHFTLK